MAKNLESTLKNEILNLQKEELRLFHSYNRHGSAEFKLKILGDIQTVIIKQDALKKLQ